MRGLGCEVIVAEVDEATLELIRRRGPVNEFAKWLYDVARKWQAEWAKARIFEADPDPSKPKFYLTAAFPYPNSPLHLGHARTYTITDVYARYKRMQGFNTLFPMGFHYTGTPILTMAEAIAAGDRELVDLFIEVYDVPPEDIPKLGDPIALARYFHEDAKKAMQEMGYSIDWRREFTTIDPEFKKFVIWQFEKLRQKGYIVKGTHPVGWCPKHNMPVGMHDTKGDVEPEIGEFTLILFEYEHPEYGKLYLPAATLRPETVFGVTNVWVRPDATYVVVDTEHGRWLVSERAAYKLTFQRDEVREVARLRGEEVLGWRVLNPATGRRVPVLPATFVDPDTATGVVMSVPAHAPFDYVAVRDLVESNRELLSKLGVSPDELKPVPVIKVKGFSDVPARDIVEKMGIRSQEERSKLEEATKQLYSVEYHYGRMREDLDKLVYPEAPPEVRRYIVAPVKAWIAGKPVPDAREATRSWLEALDYGDKMYEIMNRPVYCRCGTEIVVKVLKDQWFINYADPEWKEQVRQLLRSMRIIPPEIRTEFEKVIDWLQMRAAARTRGLGTELPWAPGWIVESLSDSVIYMAFYTVIHKIREAELKPEQLTISFWDYVLLGKGDVRRVSEETGVPIEVLKRLREEFDYWYPLDSRHSGRDLVPNHLTFFLFNHVAIFPREKWPRQIVVNGFVLLAGKKMSKSLRNIIPLRRAIRIYGPDTIRAALLASAELLQDANFTHELAMSVMGQLRGIYELAGRVAKAAGDIGVADRWLRSRLQERIEEVTRYYEDLRLRAATVTILYEMFKDVEKYKMLSGGKLGAAAREYVEAWIRMLAPIAPHIAEEAWRLLGGKGFVSTAEWPRPNPEARDPYVELLVRYADKLIEDIKEIKKLVKGEIRELVIAVDDTMSWDKVQAVAKAVQERRSLKEVLPVVLQGVEGKARGEVAQKARRLYEYLRSSDEELRRLILQVREFSELDALRVLSDYISRATGVKVITVLVRSEAEGKVPTSKLRAAHPLRPAIQLVTEESVGKKA